VPVTTTNRFGTFATTSSVPYQLRPGASLLSILSNHSATLSAVLKLDSTAAALGGKSRANRVQLLGVDATFDPMLGVSAFSNFPPDAVVLNNALAGQLRATIGDTITIRARKPDALGADSPLAPQDEAAVVLRLKVHRILSAPEGGNFNLAAGQAPPFNAFVSLPMLQEKAGVPHRANILLADKVEHAWWEKSKFSWAQWAGDRLRRIKINLIPLSSPFHTNELSPLDAVAVLNRGVERRLSLSDLQLRVTASSARNEIELRSSRVFLDPPVADAVFLAATNSERVERMFASRPYGVLTYLVNLLRYGDRSTPYSMVTAASPPLLPVELRDDEILINQWLADDLGAKRGSEIELVWFVPDQAAQLVEATNSFRVRDILPMDHPAVDRTLMPDFPGVSNAEKAGDWETGFPLVHEIREKDDRYWNDYRGTPKAFISLAAGQRIWSSRQGNLTAVRFPAPPGQAHGSWYLKQMEIEGVLRRILTGTRESSTVAGTVTNSANVLDFSPASLGFHFREVRAQALAGASQSQDFGGLFIGFSFFLILAALILMALMFQFGIEQRLAEIGTLLALGFTPSRVRRLLLGEGIAVAFVGGLIGMAGGAGYAKAMLYGLTTLWRDAVGTSALQFHATAATLVIGLFASVVVCALTIWIVLRKQARRPARELLADGADLDSQATNRKSTRRSAAPWIAIGFGGLAVAMIGWAIVSGDSASAGLFFGAGAMLLIAELAAVAVLLARLDRSGAGQRLSVSAMGLRNCTRRRSRSLASVALLACGSFLVAGLWAQTPSAGSPPNKHYDRPRGVGVWGVSTGAGGGRKETPKRRGEMKRR
jgi:ABC-type lipoprotein release transport system permease subunit